MITMTIRGQWAGGVYSGVIRNAMTFVTLAVCSLNFGEWNIPRRQRHYKVVEFKLFNFKVELL